MEWEHKGVHFTIAMEDCGEFCMASATGSRESSFIRVRPFSAMGRDRDVAVKLLQDQIRLEYRRIPAPVLEG